MDGEELAKRGRGAGKANPLGPLLVAVAVSCQLRACPPSLGCGIGRIPGGWLHKTPASDAAPTNG